MPGIGKAISRLFGRREAPQREAPPEPRPPAAPSPEAPPPTGPEAQFRQSLERKGLQATSFQPGDAPFIIEGAVSGEQIVQAWCTHDPPLEDVALNGQSLKGPAGAWVAFTTVHIAVGRVSRSWREQLAQGVLRYGEVTQLSWERRPQGGWTLTIQGSGARFDLTLTPQVGEEVLRSIQEFVQRKAAPPTA